MAAFALLGAVAVTGSAEGLRFVAPSIAAEQPVVQGPVMVNDAKKCPPGYSILEGNMADHNGKAGYSFPADAKICLVQNEASYNGESGYEVRPAGH